MCQYCILKEYQNCCIKKYGIIQEAPPKFSFLKRIAQFIFSHQRQVTEFGCYIINLSSIIESHVCQWHTALRCARMIYIRELYAGILLAKRLSEQLRQISVYCILFEKCQQHSQTHSFKYTFSYWLKFIENYKQMTPTSY